MTVIITFAIHFLPFCIFHSEEETCVTSVLQVIKRMFPWDRGLYEDKVANIWCSISVVIKLKKYLSLSNIQLLCTSSTLLLILPYIVLLYKKYIII